MTDRLTGYQQQVSAYQLQGGAGTLSPPPKVADRLELGRCHAVVRLIDHPLGSHQHAATPVRFFNHVGYGRLGVGKSTTLPGVVGMGQVALNRLRDHIGPNEG